MNVMYLAGNPPPPFSYGFFEHIFNLTLLQNTFFFFSLFGIGDDFPPGSLSSTWQGGSVMTFFCPAWCPFLSSCESTLFFADLFRDVLPPSPSGGRLFFFFRGRKELFLGGQEIGFPPSPAECAIFSPPFRKGSLFLLGRHVLWVFPFPASQGAQSVGWNSFFFFSIFPPLPRSAP